MDSNVPSLPESAPRPVIPAVAGPKEVLSVRLPVMEDELHHKAQVQGELSHGVKAFEPQQRFPPLTTEALPAR